ncbi:MAG TPA: integrase arm-type DNA-binding domain-containing protein [Allosphingosinicella sp.]
MLTDARCRSAKPAAKAQKLADAKGLHLFITPSGHKAWRWKYRFQKKEKLLTFGAYPEVTLAAARELRDAAARQLRAGKDPAAERKAQAAPPAEVVVADPFEQVARSWHARQRRRWDPRHAADVMRCFERDVFPALGSKAITDIDVPAVLEVIQAIENRGAVETGRRTRQRIEAVFASAIASGKAKNNPAAVITPAALEVLVKKRQPAFRKLEDARKLLKTSEESPAHPLTKLASRLLAITAARPGILRRAEPHEFLDLDGSAPIWHIPADKMKLTVDRKEDETFDFLIPLPTQAVAIVKAALRVVGDGPFLFPNTRHGQKPMSENAIGYMYNRLPEFRGRHVPHGWRATFSTVMNELAIERNMPGDRAVIDLMLAHVPEGVEAAYNRAAYMPRRRELAQQWADMLLEGFPAPERLLPLRRR